MLTKQKKQRIIAKYQQKDGDTGSTQVQVAILTAEIDELVSHLKAHHKDHSSRRGLLRKVGERRRLLRYFKKEDLKGYEKLVKDLNLKQAKQLEKLESIAPVVLDDVDLNEDLDDSSEE